MGTMLLGKFKISRRQLFLWVTRNSGHGRKLDLNFLVPCCRGLKFFPNGLTRLFCCKFYRYFTHFHKQNGHRGVFARNTER